MTASHDVIVVGGGIVGLATSLRLLTERPDLRLLILEKESSIATHQTGHNSGVIHAGLYYQPGSLKARLCREGKDALEAYCEMHDIPFERVGKLVVAVDESELARFESLRERAIANGVPELETIGPERMREIEPHVVGIRALWSPSTGIVDYRRVAAAYATDVIARGGTIKCDQEVTGIAEEQDGLTVVTPTASFRTRSVIACAGLWADRVARLTEVNDDGPRIVPFRGDYYTFTPDARHLVNGLVYPVPDPRFPFLGVHFTKRIDGEVWAGPNAVLAFKRAGYRRHDFSARDLFESLAYPGFRRLARAHLRTGLAEMWRDVSKRAFLAEMRRYVPDLRADQITFGPSGVRAQALSADGRMVDDFDLAGSARILHVRNAPSPAATAALAIGGMLAAQAIDRFEL